MTNYQAYITMPDVFESLDEAAYDCMLDVVGATAFDNPSPVWELRAVSVVTENSTYGAQTDRVDGDPEGSTNETQAYMVSVEQSVLGTKFTMKYILEFGVKSGEDGTGEDADGVEPAGSTTPEEPDGGAGEDQPESEAVPGGTGDLGE